MFVFYILKSYFETNTYNKIMFIFYLKENYPKKVKEKKSIDKERRKMRGKEGTGMKKKGKIIFLN